MENMEKEYRPQEGEIRVIDGRKYRWTDTGYSAREYFAHSTPEKGPGPGWDSRYKLLDNEWALENTGRTFSLKDLDDPNGLPNEPYCHWEIVME